MIGDQVKVQPIQEERRKKQNSEMNELMETVVKIEPESEKKTLKSNFRRVAFVIPVVITAVYIIVYQVWLPNAYGKGISIDNWAIKAGMYLLRVGFVASLYNLGRVLQNQKPEYNINSVLREKEPYLKAVEINEAMKGISYKEDKEAKTAVRNIMEHLRNESPFGYGSDLVIECETDIARCLRKIEDNIQALYAEKSTKEANAAIVANCKTIQLKLKIRMEMKKK